MKKILALIIALLLCLSTAVAFTGCNKDDAPDASNGGDAQTETPTEPPSPTNVEVATQSFNKLNAATFLSVVDNTLEDIRALAASAELEVSTPDGAGSIDAAINNGNLYLGADIGGMTQEFFGAMGENSLKLYGLVGGNWTLIGDYSDDGEDDLDGDIAMSPMGTIGELSDIFGEIKIPALTAEDLTVKNDKLLVSGEYIIKLISENLALAYGEEMTEEEIAEAGEDIDEALKEIGFEFYLITGAEEIVGFALSLTPAESEYSNLVSVYAELALTDDAKALKSFKLDVTSDIGFDGVECVKTSSVDFKTILAGGEFAGFELNAEIYNSEYSYNLNTPDIDFEESATDLPAEEVSDVESDGSDDGEWDDMSDIFTPAIYTETVVFTKTTVKAKLDLTKLAGESGDLLKVEVDSKAEKAYEVTTSYDLTTFEEKIESEEITDLSKIERDNLSVNAAVTMSGANKATVSFSMSQYGSTVSATGSLAVGEAATFPTIPDALKDKLN